MSFFRENPPRDDLFPELEKFFSGRSSTAWRVFGAHPARDNSGISGCLFRLWAPKAVSVAVIGDFNNWDEVACPMLPRSNGVWEAFVPGLERYDRYRYAVCGADGNTVQKADPFAFWADLRPDTASRFLAPGSPHPTKAPPGTAQALPQPTPR